MQTRKSVLNIEPFYLMKTLPEQQSFSEVNFL